MSSKYKVQYSIRSPEEETFIPFVAADLKLFEDRIEIDNRTVRYNDIESAEVTTRYQLLMPNRVLWISTKGLMYTIGPLPKTLSSSLPFNHDKTKIRSFWANELLISCVAILVLIYAFQWSS